MPLTRKTAAPSGALKRLLDTKKVDTVIVGPVERMLMSREPGAGRRQDVLHPSELAKTSHCPLADYYRLVACDEGRPLPKREANRFRSEIIFGEGHEYHRKWQEWVTSLGTLEGIWLCPSCEHWWWDTSPIACARCNHTGWKLPDRYTNMIYREVPLRSKKHRISGHADGKVKNSLLEVKSIGEGTIRIEAPMLYQRCTKKIVEVAPDDELLAPQGEPKTWVDMKALWDGIKRPFPSHIRQADIYLALARLGDHPEVDRMTFIYENKANGGSKEFVVPYSQERSDKLLGVALDIVWAVEKRRPPDCPHGGCDACRPYENEDTINAAPREASEGKPLVGRARAAQHAGLGAADTPRRGLTRAARRPDGTA